MPATAPAGAPGPVDVGVVGGGLAGSIVTALLALRGRRVLLLERERELPSTGAEALAPGAHRVLAELGLRERLGGIGAVRSEVSVFDWGRGREPWRGAFADGGPYDHGFHLDYRDLVTLVQDRAIELGARVLRGTTVLGPAPDGAGKVLRYRDSDGRTTSVEVEFAVDASGIARVLGGRTGGVTMDPHARHSMVRERRRRADLPEPVEPHTFVTTGVSAREWSWTTPLDGDTVEIGTLIRDGAPADARRQWLGYRSDELAGPGWLSVGDAAGLADPLFLSPSTVALVAAQSAAEAVEALLAEPGMGPRLLSNYADCYSGVLDCVGEFAAFCLDPARYEDGDEELVRGLTGLLNARGSGSTFARVRAALSGTAPLFDAACPDGPLMASLAMPGGVDQTAEERR